MNDDKFYQLYEKLSNNVELTSTENNQDINSNEIPISDIIEVDNNIKDISNNFQKEINESNSEEILDEVLENSNNEKQLLPLELNTYEQIKLYLSDVKGFFTSSFISEISSIALSDNALNNSKFENEIGDIIIIFCEICKKITKIEEECGVISNRDAVDEISMASLQKISKEIIIDSIPFSPYNAKAIYNEIKNNPKYFAEFKTNIELYNKYNNLINRNIEINDEILKRVKNKVESKNKVLDVIYDVQKYSTFMSRDANKCNNMDEFIQKCLLILNDTVTNLSNINNKNINDGIILDDIINNNNEFYNFVIKSENNHVRCGISIFDSLTNGGFEKERVYLLSGKTGGGKSTVLINIAYGMIKNGNGFTLNEYDIIRNIKNDKEYNKFNNFFNDGIKRLNEKDNNKHIILYVTLENSERETLRRLLLRSCLSTNILWELLSRDKIIENKVNQKGLINLNYNDIMLFENMSDELKERLYSMISYLKIINTNVKTSFKVWWRAPYTISSYDIFLECKSLERKGYIIDAVFIDYPDKMKPIESDIRKGDQSWDTLGKIIDNLKGLSKQASVPIIGVSQITRQSNKDSYNKNNIIKGGSTAGSQQKESNTDTLINMNINSKSDDELLERNQIYKKYERIINQNKSALANNIFNNDNNDNSLIYDTINESINKSNDILQLSFCIPEVQSINNYIVKNRDGLSDMSFDTYINYGMYLISDFVDESINSATFAADTCRYIIDYFQKNKIINNEETIQAFKNNFENFRVKINQFRNIINNGINNSNGKVVNNNNNKNFNNNVVNNNIPNSHY